MFGSNFNSFYGNLQNQATAGNNDARTTLTGLGASGYGAENADTQKLAYSTFLGNSGLDLAGRGTRFLLQNEPLLQRLYQSASVDNPSLHLPDFLANFDINSFLRAQPASVIGRLNAFRRVHSQY